jgi:NAD(P)-dependent dehydrogenase (short-subunit alcohol dehydrogenase family)
VIPGIGFEFVKLLNSKDCNVVIGDLRLLPESEQFTTSPTTSSAKVLFKKTDVTDWKELQELFEFTKKELGVADLVCPCAGIFEPVCFHNIWRDGRANEYRNGPISGRIRKIKATRLFRSIVNTLSRPRDWLSGVFLMPISLGS